MKKETINVPFGIRYLSDWKDFRLHQFPHILNKQIPGCGLTEWCLTNLDDLILCSPRKILLENKEEQHQGEVFRVINEFDKDPTVDKDLENFNTRSMAFLSYLDYVKTMNHIPQSTIDRIYGELMNYINTRRSQGKPVKILVTYDSFRIVKQILGKDITNYQVVIDEFQSIFTDSKFKSTTELGFVTQLQGLQRVCYVSATPMMSEYLELLEEFEKLPYYKLDWAALDMGRVIRPNLHIRAITSITTQAKGIIQSYLSGNYERAFRRDNSGRVVEFFSKEAVFYVNSVDSIIRIIKSAKLSPDQCNILVARTTQNEKRIRRKLGKSYVIGKVPLRGEPRKMFTFCTRTVYLGADFYSDNARSFVFSDANIQTLAVDISLDLPQILGRQRLSENPWKNEAWFYYRTVCGPVSPECFEAEIRAKMIESEKLLRGHGQVDLDIKDTLANLYERVALKENYRLNYVAVNRNMDGNKPVPVMNKLVIIAEKRAFDIQKFDYADRFVMLSSLDHLTGSPGVGKEVFEFFQKYKEAGDDMSKKLKIFCNSNLSDAARERVIDLVDARTSSYFSMGVDVIRATGCNVTKLSSRISNSLSSHGKLVKGNFKVGEKLSTVVIRERLGKVYKSLGLSKKIMASDLAEWFDMRPIKLKNPDTGKWEHGFEFNKKSS